MNIGVAAGAGSADTLLVVAVSACYPVCTAVLALVVLRERLTARQSVGILVVAAGIALTVAT